MKRWLPAKITPRWKRRGKTHTYTEQPGDLIRAPSELALGASKAGSYPKQQGDKSTEAFPHVSSPPPCPAWQQSLADGPVGSNWSQGHEVPTFKATSRTHISSHEHQRFCLQCSNLECKTSQVMLMLETESQEEAGEPGRWQPAPGPGKSPPFAGARQLPISIFLPFWLLHDYRHTTPTSFGAKHICEL